MKRKKGKRPVSLNEKYPPSEPCSCDICRAFCARPGWWTVEEAVRALSAGYGSRMMLEIAPEFAFGVLSPAFKGCEGDFALQEHAGSGCNFYGKDSANSTQLDLCRLNAVSAIIPAAAGV